MSAEKTKALRLAEFYEALAEEPPKSPDNSNIRAAAAELRRLSIENEALGLHLSERMKDLARVEAQRNALLEALKRMASIIDKMGDMPDEFIHPSPWQTLRCEEALTQARAAIKAVEEEA